MGESNHWLRRFIEVSKCSKGFSVALLSAEFCISNATLMRLVLVSVVASVSVGRQVNKLPAIDVVVPSGVRKTSGFEISLVPSSSMVEVVPS